MHTHFTPKYFTIWLRQAEQCCVDDDTGYQQKKTQVDDRPVRTVQTYRSLQTITNVCYRGWLSNLNLYNICWMLTLLEPCRQIKNSRKSHRVTRYISKSTDQQVAHLLGGGQVSFPIFVRVASTTASVDTKYILYRYRCVSPWLGTIPIGTCKNRYVSIRQTPTIRAVYSEHFSGNRVRFWLYQCFENPNSLQCVSVAGNQHVRLIETFL